LQRASIAQPHRDLGLARSEPHTASSTQCSSHNSDRSSLLDRQPWRTAMRSDPSAPASTIIDGRRSAACETGHIVKLITGPVRPAHRSGAHDAL